MWCVILWSWSERKRDCTIITDMEWKLAWRAVWCVGEISRQQRINSLVIMPSTPMLVMLFGKTVWMAKGFFFGSWAIESILHNRHAAQMDGSVHNAVLTVNALWKMHGKHVRTGFDRFRGMMVFHVRKLWPLKNNFTMETIFYRFYSTWIS